VGITAQLIEECLYGNDTGMAEGFGSHLFVDVKAYTEETVPLKRIGYF
jgi:hypothetical protein